MEELSGGLIEELRGGLIEDYILEFAQTFSDSDQNIPLSGAAEEDRRRKYSAAKIRKIFLVYKKCKGTQEDTVIKALAENYFIRAYAAYKIPQVQRKDFLAKKEIANSISHNDLIINSFGETEASLCAVEIAADENQELEDLRKLPARVASLTKRVEEYEVDLKLEESARRKMQEDQALEIRRLKEEHAYELTRIRDQAEDEAQRVIRRNELSSAERNRELASTLESLEKRLASVNVEIQNVQNESISRVSAAESNFFKAKSDLESEYNSRVKIIKAEALSNIVAAEKLAKQQYDERLADNKKTTDSLRESIGKDANKVAQLETEITRLQNELSFIASASLEEKTKLKGEIIVLKQDTSTCRQELANLKSRFSDLIPQVYMDADQRAINQLEPRCSIA